MHMANQLGRWAMVLSLLHTSTCSGRSRDRQARAAASAAASAGTGRVQGLLRRLVQEAGGRGPLLQGPVGQQLLQEGGGLLPSALDLGGGGGGGRRTSWGGGSRVEPARD
ncbi:hypothetical protein PVAP13_3NG102435 [Panicum virgatum]|uniref:Secreted protein n=1 Tax=Panicum virgatum TaxID=38727 RepID=A0A8T0TV48_PANVG|nr:hypothetical protein PVAP13_3NG102435 [Panicum virgatum]